MDKYRQGGSLGQPQTTTKDNQKKKHRQNEQN